MEDDMFEKMEAFINGEMNSAEKILFEKELSADETLAKRFQLYKEVQLTLQQSISSKSKEDAMQRTLAEIYDEHIKQETKVVPLRKMNKWYAVAAAAVIFTVILLFTLSRTGKPDSDALYAQYAVFPALSGTRGANDSAHANAIAFYNNRQFKEAAPLLLQWIATDSSDTEIKLAYYICELQNGNFNNALTGFLNIAATKNVFTYQARWYAALVLLKQNDTVACRKQLQQIPADADTFLKAQELLKELE